MKRYYEENKEEYKIVNLETLPFNELRVLNLSFQGEYCLLLCISNVITRYLQNPKP